MPGIESLTAKPYEHTRARAEEAMRQFGAAPLRDVVRFYFTERAPLIGTIRDDEAFFSVLLRFACGESSVAVAQNYSSSPETVLGCLSVFDLLAWLEEDLTLLSNVIRLVSYAAVQAAQLILSLVRMQKEKSNVLLRPSLNFSTRQQELARAPLLHQCVRVWWRWHHGNFRGYWWRRTRR